MGYAEDPTRLSGLTVAGVPTMGMPTIPVGANTFFVSSVAGSAGYPGTTLDQPKATLAQAMALAVANDVIVLLAGHAETVSAAGGITVAKNGLQIVGLGVGATQPTFTFATSTAATFLVTGANVSITGIRGTTSIDQLVSPFVLSGTHPTLQLTWFDQDATHEALRAVLTAATANDAEINVTYHGYTAGTHVVNAVRLVGGRNARVLINAYGVFSTAIVEFVTTAVVDAQITGFFYTSGTTNFSKDVVDTVTGSTWSVEGFDGAAAQFFSGGSGAVHCDSL